MLDKAIIYSGGLLCLAFRSGFRVDYGQDESEARRETFVYSRTTSILVPRRVARRNFKSVHLGPLALDVPGVSRRKWQSSNPCRMV